MSFLFGGQQSTGNFILQFGLKLVLIPFPVWAGFNFDYAQTGMELSLTEVGGEK